MMIEFTLEQFEVICGGVVALAGLVVNPWRFVKMSDEKALEKALAAQTAAEKPVVIDKPVEFEGIDQNKIVKAIEINMDSMVVINGINFRVSSLSFRQRTDLDSCGDYRSTRTIFEATIEAVSWHQPPWIG